MAAVPTTSEELAQFVRKVIEESGRGLIVQQFGEAALVNVQNLSQLYPEIEKLKASIEEIRVEQQTVTKQLDQSFPKLV